MQLQCPRCRTKYNLDESLLGPEGSLVRCSRCGHEFTAQPLSVPNPAPAPTPERSLSEGVPDREPPPPPPPEPEDDLMDFLDDDGRALEGLDMDDEDSGRKSSGFKKFLIILLIILIILGLALGGILFMKTRGMNLDQDYLGIDLFDYLTFLKPQEPVANKPDSQAVEEPQDPGNKRIHLAGVAGSFVELEDQKQIFIIQGKVKNSYDHQVMEIKLRGILHTKDRRDAAESVVFSGHLLAEEELKSLSRSVIEGILTNPQSGEGDPVGVGPGETVDFMIVFFDLPENLVEYTVEVVSSRPVPKTDE